MSAAAIVAIAADELGSGLAVGVRSATVVTRLHRSLTTAKEADGIG